MRAVALDVHRDFCEVAIVAEGRLRSAGPSITGIAAAGPMSPSPSTALPSETTATVCP